MFQSPRWLACRKHSKSREWDYSASFATMFLCILQPPPTPPCLRERQLHKQALVIPVFPIPAAVCLSQSPPLSFSMFVCLFFIHLPHIMSLLLPLSAFFSVAFLYPPCICHYASSSERAFGCIVVETIECHFLSVTKKSDIFGQKVLH